MKKLFVGTLFIVILFSFSSYAGVTDLCAWREDAAGILGRGSDSLNCDSSDHSTEQHVVNQSIVVGDSNRSVGPVNNLATGDSAIAEEEEPLPSVMPLNIQLLQRLVTLFEENNALLQHMTDLQEETNSLIWDAWRKKIKKRRKNR